MIDLFEDYENIPNDIQDILDKYSEDFEDSNYEGLSMALKEVRDRGYTFEYYVNGDAYGLRPIGVPLNELEGYEDVFSEFDSKIEKRVAEEYVNTELMERLKKQGASLGHTLDIKINKNRHQYKNSECGVYCIYFITSLLDGKSFEEVENNIISDDNMNAKRQKFFNHSDSDS